MSTRRSARSPPRPTTKLAAITDSKRYEGPFAELDRVAFAGLRDLDNSPRDDLSHQIRLPDIVQRRAGVIERLAHDPGHFGIEGGVLKERQAAAHVTISRRQLETAAGDRASLSVM